MPCFQHFLFSVSDLLIKKRRSQNRLNVASSTSGVRNFFFFVFFIFIIFFNKRIKKKRCTERTRKVSQNLCQVAQGAESNFTAWTHHERTTIDSSVQTEFSWRETMTSKMLSRELKVLKGKLLVSWPVSSI